MILDDEQARVLVRLATHASPSLRWTHEEQAALLAGARALEAQARARRADDVTRPTKVGEPGDGA